MAVNAVGANGTELLSSPRDRGLSDLKTEDFFKILVSELKQQDPFEPTKTADMIGQVSQIRSIEQSAKLNTTLDALANRQYASGASDMLGKFVVALTQTPDGGAQPMDGVVTGVRFTADGKSILELDNGDVVRLEDVIQVTTPENAASIDADALAAQVLGGKPDATSKASEAEQQQDKPVFNFGLFQL